MRTTRRTLLLALLVARPRRPRGVVGVRDRTPGRHRPPATPARSSPRSAPSRGRSTGSSRSIEPRWSCRCCSTRAWSSSITRRRTSSRRWPTRGRSADGRTYTLSPATRRRLLGRRAVHRGRRGLHLRGALRPETASPLASGLRVNGQPLAVRKVDAHTVVLTLPRAVRAGPARPAAACPSCRPTSCARRPGSSRRRGPRRRRRPRSSGSARSCSARTPRASASSWPAIRTARRAPERRGVHAGPRSPCASSRPRTPSGWPSRPASWSICCNADIRPEDLKAVRGLERRRQGSPLRSGPGGRRGRALVQPRAGRAAGRARPWLDARFRRAVVHAVDRAAFVDTVYLGAGVPVDGPVPPGNRVWYSTSCRPTPTIPRGPRAAHRRRPEGSQRRRHPRDVDGQAAAHRAPHPEGHAIRERGAEVIASDLKDVGLAGQRRPARRRRARDA